MKTKKEIITESVMHTETIRTIFERRAVRKYRDQPVGHATLARILDAGRMAPSAMNKQPWKFYILTKRETIRLFSDEIAKIVVRKGIKGGPGQILKTVAGLLHFSFGTRLLKGGDPVFYGAPVVVFITAPKDNEWAGLDIGMCCQNMMLTAKSLGLDSCPIGFGKYVAQTKIYARLKVPETDEVHLAVTFGYGNEKPAVHPRITSNVFYIDSAVPSDMQEHSN